MCFIPHPLIRFQRQHNSLSLVFKNVNRKNRTYMTSEVNMNKTQLEPSEPMQSITGKTMMTTTMTTTLNNNIVPEKEINRTLFNTTLNVYALKVPPKLCQPIRKVFKSHLLIIPRVHNVVKPPNSSSILILSKYLATDLTSTSLPVLGNIDQSYINKKGELSEIFSTFSSEKLSAMTAEAKKKKQKKKKKKKEGQDEQQHAEITEENTANGSIEHFIPSITDNSLTLHDLNLSYVHYSIEQVLKTIIPSNLQIPSSFESIGHIAHLNLRDEHKPWKYDIGQVMLDKLQPRIKTIVNKIENTGGPYRIFKMEVLSGEKNFETKVKENNCTFELDFSKVYWNSRLETEHRRIIDLIQPNEIVVDAFCGIGPFIIPIAKKNITKQLYGNDLNPSSIHYLDRNIQANSIPSSSIVHTSCNCARKFLTDLIQVKQAPVSRIIMNLPSGAPEFLSVFKGLYNNWTQRLTHSDMPIVHCYCFIKGELDTNSARKRVRKALLDVNDDNDDESVKENSSLPKISDDDIDVRVVRDVAPKKVKVCVTFKIPIQIALYGKDSEEPQKKKPKTSQPSCRVT